MSIESKEQFVGERESKLNNLLELRDFLQKELGDYFGLFATTLRTQSGIKDPSELPRDKEERRRIIEEALATTPITQENIESINRAIRGVVNVNKAEVEHFGKKPGREKYIEDCQKVIDILGDRKLTLDENGAVSLTEMTDR